MKRSKFVLILILIFLFLLCSCGKTSEQDFKLKQDEVYVKEGSEVNLASLFDGNINGDVLFSTNDLDIISIDKNICEAKKVGVAEVFAMLNDNYLIITINVVKNDEDIPGLAEVVDTTTTYDGTKKYIDIINLPSGCKIEYIYNGEKIDGLINAGEYEITVKLFDTQNKELEMSKNKAKLTILKAEYRVNVQFSKNSFIYDGTEKEVNILSDLPKGMKATLVNNKHTNAGSYIVRADFSNPDPTNYYDMPSANVLMTISSKFVYLNEYNLINKQVVYNGEEQNLGIKTTIENVINIKYYTYEDSKYILKNAEPKYIDSGKYVYVISLEVNETTYLNYTYIAPNSEVVFTKQENNNYVSNILSVDFEITKAKLENTTKLELLDVNGNSVNVVKYKDRISFPWEKLNQYEYELVLTGDYSKGIKNEFEGKTRIEYIKPNRLIKNDFDNYDVGEYIFEANIIFDDDYQKNYIKLDELLLRIQIDRIDYDMKNVTFTYENDTAEYTRDVNYESLMGVKNYNEVDLTVNYYFYKDNSQYVSSGLQNIKNVGQYRIFARFTLNVDANNYNTIPNMYQTYANSTSQYFQIQKKNVEITNISLPNFEKVYDGNIYNVTITGIENIDEDISYTITINNEQTTEIINAGSYLVKATFQYKDYDKTNVKYIINNVETNEITSSIIVNKATYDNNYVNSKLSLFTQKEIPTFNTNLKISDIKITSGDAIIDSYVEYNNPNSLINLTRLDTELDTTLNVPIKAYYMATINYCEDRVNYNVKNSYIELCVNRQLLDVTSVTINNQFISNTNNSTPHIENIDNSLIKVTSNKSLNATQLYQDVTFTITPINEYGIILLDNDIACENNKKDILVEKIYVYEASMYKYKKGTTILTSFAGTAGNLQIIDGTTKIEARAFNNASVNILNLPDTVEEMEDSSLLNIASLKGLNIPTTLIYSNKSTNKLTSLNNLFGGKDKVPNTLENIIVRNDTKIYSNFFNSNSIIKTITYENAITEIEQEALFGCTSLTTIVDANSLKSLNTIGKDAFRNCQSIKSITLPLTYFNTSTLRNLFGNYEVINLEKITIYDNNAENKTITSEAFRYFSTLKEIVFPNTLEVIEGNSFQYLTCDIDLSNTKITTLSTNMFYGYHGENILLPPNIQIIGSYAFSATTNLKRIVIPTTVTTIYENAFEYSKARVKFEKSDNYTSLGEKVFFNFEGEIESLGSINIVGDNAFYNSTISTIDLTNIQEIGNNAFYNCASLTSVTTSNILTTVKSKAFYLCVSLRSFEFWNNMSTIESDAFFRCDSLVNIKFTSTTCPQNISSSAFSLTRVINVYVPSGSVDSYKQTFDVDHFIIIEGSSAGNNDE